MIENTFILLDGIGAVTERRLWQQNILTWNDFISVQKIKRISSKRKKDYDKKLENAQIKLKNENCTFFSQCLDAKEHWRLYEPWKNKACFLDIETTGFHHGITMVGIYSYQGYTCFIKGENLEKDALEKELEKYNILVTFYGRAFDVPFIQRELGIAIDIPHIDLCFTGKKLGLKGGLKKVEKCVGIERDEDIKGMDGFDAVRLWKKYEKGDDTSLELLIKYNRADTVNLKVLADIMYGKLKQDTFLCWQTPP